jgi:hypothetical protein
MAAGIEWRQLPTQAYLNKEAYLLLSEFAKGIHAECHTAEEPGRTNNSGDGWVGRGILRRKSTRVQSFPYANRVVVSGYLLVRRRKRRGSQLTGEGAEADSK